MERKFYINFNLAAKNDKYIENILNKYKQLQGKNIHLYISATKKEVLETGFINNLNSIIKCLNNNGISNHNIVVALNINQSSKNNLLSKIENPHYYSPVEWEKIKKFENFLIGKNINFVFDELLTSYALSEVETANSKISQVANTIKYENKSPLEKLLTAYRVVTERNYVKSGKLEEPGESRSIYSILNSNKIVCAGFALYLKSIMEEIGDENIKIYENFVALSKNNKKINGHHENLIVYIKDEKYNIDGYYCLDPTNDCSGENIDFHQMETQNLNYFMLPLGDISKNKIFIRRFSTNLPINKKNKTHISNVKNGYSIDPRLSISMDTYNFSLDFLLDLFERDPGLAEKIVRENSKVANYRANKINDTFVERKLFMQNFAQDLEKLNISYITYHEKKELVNALFNFKNFGTTELQKIRNKIISKYKNNSIKNHKLLLSMIDQRIKLGYDFNFNKLSENQINYLLYLEILLLENKTFFANMISHLNEDELEKVLQEIISLDDAKNDELNDKSKLKTEITRALKKLGYTKLNAKDLTKSFAIGYSKIKDSAELIAFKKEISKTRRYFKTKAIKLLLTDSNARMYLQNYLSTHSEPICFEKLSTAIAQTAHSAAYKNGDMNVESTILYNQIRSNDLFKEGAKNPFFTENYR